MKATLVPFYQAGSLVNDELTYDGVFLIDVYRATSTMVVLANRGAKQIKVVSSLEAAFSIRDKDHEALLCGERDSIKPEAFDYGNDTGQLSQIDFTGKSCVITTSNGTRALRAYANTSDTFYACSVLNLNACLSHIKESNYKNILILCAGNWGMFSLEDYLCASMLINGVKDSLDEVCDEIKLAIELGAVYTNNPNTLKVALEKTDHAQKLKSQHKFDDVLFITAHINAYNCVPKLEY